AHLFVSDLHGGVATFAIAHDALLRRWPRVLAWIDQHRQALQVRTRLGAQARRWQASGCARDMLLPRGTQANQARGLLGDSALTLNAQELAFVTSSLRRVRLAERFRMLVSGVVLGLALLASALGAMARSAQFQAEQRRTEAEALMGFMLGEFVDKLRPLGRLDLLDSISNRALSYLSAARQSDLDATALTQRAKALQVISEVKIARADPAAAEAGLGAARAILQQQLRGTPADIAILKSAGENAYWLGQIHLDQRNWDFAQQYFGEYRDLADRLATAAPRDPDSWIEQSYAHNSLGSLALRRGDIERAASEFALSVELKSAAYRASPNDKRLAADLADSLSWLANAQLLRGKLELAGVLHGRELDLLWTLHESAPGEALWTHRLASAWSHQAELKQASGDVRAAYGDALQAESLLQTIVQQDPSNRSWQHSLYVAQLNLIELAPPAPDPEPILARLATLHEAFAALSRLEPKKLTLRLMMERVTARRAALLLEQRHHAEAANVLAPAVANLTALHAKAPADEFVRNTLAQVLVLESDIAFKQNDPVAARASCRRVQTLLQPAVNGRADYYVLAPWVSAHVCLDESAKAAPARRQLEAMPYRDPAYLLYLSTHQTKKADK
ncbi:MAG TPA: transcriptional regulator, partial [Telluria sp.]|nr:transcriptional regulator [Telluria sp.]